MPGKERMAPVRSGSKTHLRYARKIQSRKPTGAQTNGRACKPTGAAPRMKGALALRACRARRRVRRGNQVAFPTVAYALGAQRRGSRLSMNSPESGTLFGDPMRSVPNAGMTRIRFKGCISVPNALAPWRVLLPSSGFREGGP